MAEHDPRVRYCIVITNPPLPDHLFQDNTRCPACDDLHRLMHLDPDVTEILSREPWCAACLAGDKAEPKSLDSRLDATEGQTP